MSAVSLSTRNPFPGLPPFDREESHLFFGRDGQVEELLARLNSARLVAVVGVSGSGKSSLVRAGLLPALYGGFLGRAGSRWRIAVMRPGADPLGHLARALAGQDAFGSADAEIAALQRAFIEAALRSGSRGLVEAFEQEHLPPQDNLLVVVDQFEEIFRFADPSRGSRAENEAAAFVKLLLEATRQRALPIYVLLTMRSDFLGNCAQFWDLPEAINEGQYLIPRLTYEERREAITGPVAVAGAEITTRLVNRLLSDLGDDPGQLPVLQHALMRTWEEWRAKGAPAHAQQHAGTAIDLCCYEAIGGMKEALSRHGEEVYREAADHLPGGRGQRITEGLFRTLTTKDENNRATRRPTELREICRIIDADEAEVKAVIELFRAPGRSFLMPPALEPLAPETTIDISHESLCLNWARLRDWVEREEGDATTYRRLAEDAEQYRKKQGKDREAFLWTGAKLRGALEVRARGKLTAAWAERNYPRLEVSEAIAFLEAGERAEGQRRSVRIMLVGILALAGIVSAAAAAYALKKNRDLERALSDNRGLLYSANVNAAYQSWAGGAMDQTLKLLEESRQDGRFEWAYLWNATPKPLVTLSGHTGGITTLAFTRDSRQLATGGEDGAIRLWETDTGKAIATLAGQKGGVFAVAFSPDGRRLAAGGEDGSIRLWEAGKAIAEFAGHTGNVSAITFSPDGQTLASGGGDGSARLWEAGSGKAIATLAGHAGNVSAVAFSPDGRTLASGGDDKVIRLWEVASGRSLAALSGHTGAIFAVAFSPDGRLLASGASDQTARLWETSAGRPLAVLKGHTEQDVYTVAFSPDGRLLASGGQDQTVRLWETGTARELATLKGHTGYVSAIAFSSDGRTLATGGADRTARLWDLSLNRALITLDGHTGNIYAVKFAPDGQSLASGGQDGVIRLWEAGTGREKAALSGHSSSVRAIAWAPDSLQLASGGEDGVIRLWDSGREKTTLKGQDSVVRALAWSRDSRLLASGGDDGVVRLWDVGAGSERAALKGHRGGVAAVAFAPDDRLLASGGQDGTVRLWDVSAGREIAALSGHTLTVLSLAWSTNGRTLGTGGADRTVRLWVVGEFDGDQWRVPEWQLSGEYRFVTLTGHANNVSAVAFTPDGRALASGSWDGSVRLWEVSTGRALATLGGSDAISSVAFAPDGRTLAAVGVDRLITLRRAASAEEIAASENRRRSYPSSVK